MFAKLVLPALAASFTLTLVATAPAVAQSDHAAPAKAAKTDTLTPEKKRAADAFIDSLGLESSWPQFIAFAQQSMADEARAGIAEGAALDDLPADKRAKADVLIEELLPHIVQDLQTEFEKIDPKALYHEMGYAIYAQAFSTAELKQLAAIYSAPAYRRAMPRIVELRKTKPEATDDDLRQAIGKADFNWMAHAMQSRAYAKLMQLAPTLQEAVNQYLGTALESVGEKVGKKYGPIFMEKLKPVLEEAPATSADATPQTTPAKVETNSEAATPQAAGASAQ